MKEALEQYSHVTLASEKKQRRSEKPPHLTAAQIKAIAEKVRSGEIKLPDLDLPSDSDYHAVWFLHDPGSSVNAIDFEKHLPGVTSIQVPKEKRSTYSTASGQPIQDEGYTVIKALTDNKHEQTFEIRDVKVDFPSLSTGYLTHVEFKTHTNCPTMRWGRFAERPAWSLRQVCAPR